MIAVIFDLDGVLVDARDIHYECLNKAIASVLGDTCFISRADHLGKYDGLPTFTKLDKLAVQHGVEISQEQKNSIWMRKQNYTEQAFAEIQRDEGLIYTMQELKKLGEVKLFCCSNSIRRTTEQALTALGIREYFDGVYGNDDVKQAKPNPEMYLHAMIQAGVGPTDTLVIEDSPVGREAVRRSGAHGLFVKNRQDLWITKIYDALGEMQGRQQPKKLSRQVNVLIPMAGGGTRFAQAGYSFPKPLIEVKGDPMIKTVVDSIGLGDGAHYTYIAQKSHYDQFSLKYMLNLITNGCSIVTIDGITEGAACTTLLAEYYINDDRPLLICNSDQYVEWDREAFFHMIDSDDPDAAILTFEATHPKWSYAKLDENGYVTEVAEKKPISNLATVGMYYWKRGSDYVKYANRMIQKNIRVNNEFYVCPVFNEAIADGKKVVTFPVKKMMGLGTPEDLQAFLRDNK